MSFILALAGQWKMGLMGLCAAGLLIGGWQASQWRTRAHEADRLEMALDFQRQATDLANAARAKMANEIAETETQIVETTREVIKKVKVYVPLNPDCDLSPNAIELLNRARRPEVPTAAVSVVGPNANP